MSYPNINRPSFDEPRDYPGFRSLRARLGRQAGTTKTGLSLFDVPPGQAAYPYHWHLAEEELIVVLAGRPSLRTPQGWRELEEGEVVAFLVGEDGAHQLVNRTDEPVRFLAFSNQQPDIIVRPDSQTIGAAERRPEGVDWLTTSGFRTPLDTSKASTHRDAHAGGFTAGHPMWRTVVAGRRTRAPP